MRARERVVSTLRSAGSHVPTGVRGPVGRATRRFRSGFSGPLVSVVLPVSDDETTRIGPMLDEVRDSSHRNLEVLVVPFGRTDTVRPVVETHAEADWRIRVLRPQGDLTRARNTGTAAARGEYLVVVRGGDNLPRYGLGRLVQRLERTGSDFAVGRQERPDVPMAVVTAPLEAAHRTGVTGTTLAASPVAATDLGLGNKLFRTSWWRSQSLAFADGTEHRHDVVLDAYARGRFDLLSEGTYVPTDRRDGVAVGSALPVLDGLSDWVREQEGVAARLRSLDVPNAFDQWLWGVMDTAVHPFLDDVERATDEQWELLRTEVERLEEHAGPEVRRLLRAESKVKLALARRGLRAELARFVAGRWFTNGNVPTEVADGVVRAQLPFHDDTTLGLPDEAFEMSEAELPMRLQLHGAQWLDGAWVLDLYARIDFVSMPEPPQVQARLVPDGGGAAVPVTVELTPDPRANQGDANPQRFQDFAQGAVRLRVDPADVLAAAADGPWRGQVEVSLATGGLTRTSRITAVDDRGSAGMLDTGHLPPRVLGEWQVGLAGGSHPAVVVSPAPRLRWREVALQGRRLHGTLEATRPGAAPTHLRVDGAGRLSERARLTPQGQDAWQVDLTVPRGWVDPGRARWSVTAESGDGELDVAWPAPDATFLGEGAGSLVLMRSDSGGTTLVEATRSAVIERHEVLDGLVRLTGRWLGEPPATPRFVLGRPEAEVEGTVVVSTPEQLVVEFGTRHDPWQLRETLLPTGRYWVTLTSADGKHPGKVWLGEEALTDLLRTRVSGGFHHRMIRMGRDVGLFLRAPVTDRDRGPHPQAVLQQWHATTDAPIAEDLVYLQSYAGVDATDSQLALHHQIVATRPDLRIVWGVASESVWTPPGAERVVMQTREWYEAMATAKYLSLNIDVDRWFHVRDGQRLLQTFHGYPSKSMGLRMWRAKGYTPLRIEHELARTRDDWSLILTPSPEMDVHYRTEYAYEGPIHSQGYPRDDVLRGPDAERLRAETRARLGIAEGQKAILYGPTWRDDKATNWRRAEAVLHLDITAASRALGPDYVFLMRGHRFHQPAVETPGARMIDVTAYPEINDLILASDAAVLDYSSLRFDFSLTGRPMVFLVPDLDEYVGGIRGFLYDYRSTAPGPLVDDVDQVVAHLRDLDRLSRDHAEQYAAYDQQFNRYMDGRAAERVAQAWLT